MPNYRRWYVPGGQYFFTVVTWKRTRIFQDPHARKLLGDCFRQVRASMPFEVPAIVLLPDHLHCVWTLPPGDDGYSMRWKVIKRHFSRSWTGGKSLLAERNPSCRRRQELCVWQRRFWEHVIRDEREFSDILDYIHYNPVKHGYVARPGDWEASSFGRFVRAGLYEETWGVVEPKIRVRLDQAFE